MTLPEAAVRTDAASCEHRWKSRFMHFSFLGPAMGTTLGIGRSRRGVDIIPREPHNGCLVMKGGLPETEEWVRRHWK